MLSSRAQILRRSISATSTPAAWSKRLIGSARVKIGVREGMKLTSEKYTSPLIPLRKGAFNSGMRVMFALSSPNIVVALT